MEKLSENLRRYVLIVAIHLVVVLIWYLFVVIWEVPEFVMPTPADTLMSLGEDYNWLHNTMITAGEVFGGYLLAVAVGVGLALLFSWSPKVDRVFMPLIVSLNMIPKVALGPLFIVWFSYGLGPNIIITFSICFLPVLITTARGLREVEPDLIDLVRSLRGSRWQIFTKIQLPGSLPYVFSGMKVAVVLAVAGAIVGEFIASEEGLGYLMLQVQVTLDTAAMFMAVLLITLVGVVLYGLVLLLERLFVVQDARVD
jgi:NitT/TauT family transport system permease protein